MYMIYIYIYLFIFWGGVRFRSRTGRAKGVEDIYIHDRVGVLIGFRL